MVPELRGHHLPQAGLRPPVVVIVDVVADLRDYVVEGLASPKDEIQLRGCGSFEEARAAVISQPASENGLGSAA